MDNVNLALLSTARHHQRLEEFQPQSQSGDGEGDLSQASLRGEKRRGSNSPQKEISGKKKAIR